MKFDLKKFLKDEKLANDFAGGTLIIFRLAPDDYHRFHFPLDCTPTTPIRIKGILESVNPVVYKSGMQVLTENERFLIQLTNTACGTVLMIPVGAMCVGKIKHTFIPNQSYKKGDEAGYFEFGGSTVVLLFQKNTLNPLPNFIQHSQEGYESVIKMGEAVTK